MLGLEIWADPVGHVGLLCVLCICLSETRRVVADERKIQWVTGFVFGLISAIEMHLPFEPVPQAIVDLRSIPVVLAGAFLGWRGLMACLIVAIATHVHMGGTGMTAGILSVIMAGYAGIAWASLTRRNSPRTSGQMLLLGGMACLSFVAAFFMPAPLSLAFLTYAVPVLGVTYLIVVPLLGSVLQREILRVKSESHLRRGTFSCPDSGLLKPGAFLRETARLAVCGPPGDIGGLMVITPTYPSWMNNFGGSAVIARLEAALAKTLMEKLTHANRIGLSRDGRLLVLLTQAEAARDGAFFDDVSRHVVKKGLRLGPSPRVQIRFRHDAHAPISEAELASILRTLDAENRGRGRSPVRTPFMELKNASSHPLFEKLDRALAMGPRPSAELDE
jgi:hypothetical protein